MESTSVCLKAVERRITRAKSPSTVDSRLAHLPFILISLHYTASLSVFSLLFRPHTDGVPSVKFYPDGRQLVSSRVDGTIRFWDPKTGEPGLVLKSLLGRVWSLDYSHDGRWIVSGHNNGEVQLWDAISGEPGPVLRGHMRAVTGIAFSLDDQLIASSSNDRTFRLWDFSTGVCASALTGHTSGIAFSPDGIQLASGDGSRSNR